MEMYRQGDLLLIRTEENPYGDLKNSRDILGSSVTGHTHRITKGTVWVNNNPDWQHRENFFIEVPEGTKLVHDEHDPITLSAGRYKVIRQREVNGYVAD